MATNQTTNYQLNQWQPTDPVQRTDFNADNATVEAALTDLETRVAILDRVVPDLAYYIGELGVLDVMHRDYYLSLWSMTYDAFQFPEDITVTGQAVVENGVLTVNGSGTASTYNIRVGRGNWTKARLWLRFSGSGTTVPYLSGNEMEYVSSYRTRNTAGESCMERSYLWEGTGGNAVQVKLDVSSDGEEPVVVYDFRLFLF